MHHRNSDLIDRAALGLALSVRNISDDELALTVAVMNETWRAEIAARLGKLAADLQDLASVAAEAERRFLDATEASSRA